MRCNDSCKCLDCKNDDAHAALSGGRASMSVGSGPVRSGSGMAKWQLQQADSTNSVLMSLG